jgi:hypothetical protein
MSLTASFRKQSSNALARQSFCGLPVTRSYNDMMTFKDGGMRFQVKALNCQFRDKGKYLTALTTSTLGKNK